MTSVQMVVLTNELLGEIACNGVGWNKRQLRILGIKGKPTKGWRARLIGKRIPESDLNRLIALRRRPRAERRAARLATEQSNRVF